MTTASEGGTRCMCRSEQPKVQLDIMDVWHGLCLGAFAVTYRLLGFAPDSDQYLEIAQLVAEFMFRNMRDKDTGYLSDVFDIIHQRHTFPLSMNYGYIILGLFTEYEWNSDTSSRSTIVYRALQAHLAQRKVAEQRMAQQVPVNAMQTDIDVCCDTVCAWHEHGFSVSAVVQQVLYDSSSDHHREVASHIAEFLREHMPDEEQHRKNMYEDTSRHTLKWKSYLGCSPYSSWLRSMTPSPKSAAS